MIFKNQKSIIDELMLFKDANKQTVLIEGPSGSGKTWLANYYKSLLGIADFQIIEPKIQTLKEIIDQCYIDGSPIVLCIENLDLGVLGASYTLLKFIEEPLPNIYIVITCRNLTKIPDTIISRSATLHLNSPTSDDIVDYAKSKSLSKYEYLNDSNLWKCIDNFNDVDIIFNMNQDKLDYFNNLNKSIDLKSNVSNIVWNIQKYPDNTDTDTTLVIKYILNMFDNPYVWKIGFNCLSELDNSRISKNAIITNFVFDLKYM